MPCNLGLIALLLSRLMYGKLNHYVIMIEIKYSATDLLLLVNPHIPHQNNITVHPTYVLIVRKEDTSLPARYTPV